MFKNKTVILPVYKMDEFMDILLNSPVVRAGSFYRTAYTLESVDPRKVKSFCVELTACERYEHVVVYITPMYR